MQTAGTEHFIERAYRETGRYQWVRETFINASEAGATRIEYSIDWQAVESLGVYRRTIADNGAGMSADQLVEFFNTFGGSGKPIGGLHENYGVGAKTSLLPWNKYGLVVISWQDGDASMIWVMQDPETGAYGLKIEPAVDPETGDESLETVYAPYIDEKHGCNWESVKPDWIDDHGTVIVLLGNTPEYDTVEGDPDRGEADIKGISAYLNRRLWEIPADIGVRVLEFHSMERKRWPRTPGVRTDSDSDKVATQWRNIEGARYYIVYPMEGFNRGKLEAYGTVELDHDIVIDWFLWSGDRPRVGSYAAESGYIGTLYKNELYGVVDHNATYRSFGISEASVRRNIWLIARPPQYSDNDRHGVYPRQDRNALLLKGGPNAGSEIPLTEWGAEFSQQMPQAIVSALQSARQGRTGTIDDQSWRDRLAERFGARWRVPKLRLRRKKGSIPVDPEQAGGVPRRKVSARQRSDGTGRGGGSGGRGGAATLGSHAGPHLAERVKVAGGIPSYRTVTNEEIGNGMLAAWQPNDPNCPEGVVLLNVEHPVLTSQIEYWQSHYPDHFADEIADEVVKVYGELAVAKIAHSQHLRGIIPSQVIDEKLRSEEALTMALLGLIAEEAVLAPRLGGKFKKQKIAT